MWRGNGISHRESKKTMNILQLSVHFSPNVGGVETHLDDLVQSLSNRNDTVFVLTYQPLVTKTTWKLYEKKKNVEIFRLPWIAGYFYSLVTHPIVEFLYLVPGLFVMTPFVVSVKNINVIHAHGLIAGFVGVFWGKLFRKRVLVSLHNIYHFPKEGLYTRFVRYIFNNAAVVLCLSKQSVREVEALGIEKKKIVQFTYWIDLQTFHKIPHAKKQLGWDNKFILLFVGRLIPEKGLKELLQAATDFNKEITLVIAGVGPLEKEIQAQTVKNENIIFLGKITNSKLPLYYSAADVLIVPSVHEEGFGRVLLESMACGTPVIAANRGAIPEAIDTSVGELISITPEIIARTVNSMYDRPEKLKQMAQNARSFTEKRYSEKNFDVIFNTYAGK